MTEKSGGPWGSAQSGLALAEEGAAVVLAVAAVVDAVDVVDAKSPVDEVVVAGVVTGVERVAGVVAVGVVKVGGVVVTVRPPCVLGPRLLMVVRLEFVLFVLDDRVGLTALHRARLRNFE